MRAKLIFLILIISYSGYSQRWYAINDSTSYQYNDLTITVGRNKVYLNLNNTLSLIRDFSINNPQIPDDYIRDFDFIDENTWYVLVGSRYIGNRTELYKTENSGLTWQLIIPQSFTVPSTLNGIADSINQIQFLNGRIYLFDAYYTSRVFYSDDLGQTWTHWFECFWSHYYQIYACGNDLYIHGLAGDGFRPYMVQIPQSYIGQQNIFTTNVGSCHNGGTPGCYYAPSNISPPEVVAYFTTLFNATICNLSNEENVNQRIIISPNPANDIIHIEGLETAIPFKAEIINVLGEVCITARNSKTIELSKLASGLYFLHINQGKLVKTSSFLKK